MNMTHWVNFLKQNEKKAKVPAVITDNINENKFDTLSELR
jgi:hypothetical protein